MKINKVIAAKKISISKVSSKRNKINLLANNNLDACGCTGNTQC